MSQGMICNRPTSGQSSICPLLLKRMRGNPEDDNEIYISKLEQYTKKLLAEIDRLDDKIERLERGNGYEDVYFYLDKHDDVAYDEENEAEEA